jgi:hypothetical protein
MVKKSTDYSTNRNSTASRNSTSYRNNKYSGTFDNSSNNGNNGNNGVYVSFPAIIIIALVTIAGLLFYIIFTTNTTNSKKYGVDSSLTQSSFAPPNTTVVEIGGHADKFNDPYYPPLKNDGVFFPIDSGDLRGVPPSLNGVGGGVGGVGSGRSINIQTRGFSPEFTQIGILTREVGNGKNKKGIEESVQNDPKILPLMGRRVMNGRDKYQYYTISNSGNVNTKLPIRKEGRNCINEYGCDPLYNGDIVFVEGYGDKFKATIYENELFRYIP